MQSLSQQDQTGTWQRWATVLNRRIPGNYAQEKTPPPYPEAQGTNVGKGQKHLKRKSQRARTECGGGRAVVASERHLDHRMSCGQLGKYLSKEQGVSADGREATRFPPGWFALDNSGRC